MSKAVDFQTMWVSCTWNLLDGLYMFISQSHKLTFSLRFSGHNLESSEVFVYNVYITNQFQTTFALGGGGERGGIR
jgi:hypothetical protein